jgi:hypothetical protein
VKKKKEGRKKGLEETKVHWLESGGKKGPAGPASLMGRLIYHNLCCEKILR